MSYYTAVLRSIGGKFSLLKNILFFIVKILPKSLLVNYSDVRLYINPQDLRNFTDSFFPSKFKNRSNEAFYSLIEKDDCVIDVGGNIGLSKGLVVGGKVGLPKGLLLCWLLKVVGGF